MVEVVVDIREQASPVPALLREMGAEVKLRSLSVADYVVSERVGIERKAARDYISSLFSGRLFDQASRLREAYEKPVILVEGYLEEEHFNSSSAIWGSLFSLSLDMGVTVLQGRDESSIAEAILTLAKREQEERRSKPRIRPKPRMMGMPEKQLFLVSGLPSIGSELAERLLEHFRTPRRVFAAREGELVKVPGIGRKKARAMVRVLDAEFRAHRQELLDE
ncbi:ERCC4 domain-containing protein [Candidatus Pyrohabitans sp.]